MLETLKKMVENTPGAKAAILMGFDGIAVEQYVVEGADTDIESMAMEFSFRLIELRKAAASLEMGEVSEIAVRADAGTVLVRCLGEEYFVAMLMQSHGHFGKGRWLLRSTAASLQGEL
jgi:predicted regulator of Ras-like GTPase activity (Roadblock/LC7/MglB family)